MEEKVGGKRIAFRFSLPAGVALLTFHIFAISRDLYRSIPSIDILSHFGATVTGGLVVYWLIVRYPNHIDLGKNMFFTLLIGLSLGSLGGVLWEFIEFAYDIIAPKFNPGALPVQLSLGDTMKDLLFNSLGGLAVAIFVWLRYYRKHRSS